LKPFYKVWLLWWLKNWL